MKNIIKIFITLILGNSFLLSECIQGDCENGYGTSKNSNGVRYVGEWRDGEPWNTTVYKPNGFKSGEYKNGVFTFQ